MSKNTAKSTRKRGGKRPSLAIEVVYERKYIDTIFEPMHPFDVAKVAGIKIIAFNDKNKILAIRKPKKFDPSRRLDIISGCHEGGDKDYEEAVLREAREEANVTLGSLHLAAVIERKFTDVSFADSIYFLVISARITGIIPYDEYQEPNNRYFLTKENFLKRYNAGKAEDIAKLVAMAEFVIEDSSECDPYVKRILACC